MARKTKALVVDSKYDQAELNKILAELPPQNIDESGTRENLVRWSEVVEHFSGKDWFKISDIRAHVTKTYPKTKLHYSESLEFIRRTHKGAYGKFHVTKKRVPPGQILKGVFYKIDPKGP